MAKWNCYFPRPWHGNKCLRTCNGKQLEAYCECGKAVRGAKVDSDCGWVGIVSESNQNYKQYKPVFKESVNLKECEEW